MLKAYNTFGRNAGIAGWRWDLWWAILWVTAHFKKEERARWHLIRFPLCDFKLASFTSIANLKQALRAGNGLKASFKFTSNSKYVGIRCKVPKCPAFLSYRISDSADGKILLLKNLATIIAIHPNFTKKNAWKRWQTIFSSYSSQWWLDPQKHLLQRTCPYESLNRPRKRCYNS